MTNTKKLDFTEAYDAIAGLEADIEKVSAAYIAKDSQVGTVVGRNKELQDKFVGEIQNHRDTKKQLDNTSAELTACGEAYDILGDEKSKVDGRLRSTRSLLKSERTVAGLLEDELEKAENKINDLEADCTDTDFQYRNAAEQAENYANIADAVLIHLAKSDFYRQRLLEIDAGLREEGKSLGTPQGVAYAVMNLLDESAEKLAEQGELAAKIIEKVAAMREVTDKITKTQ